VVALGAATVGIDAVLLAGSTVPQAPDVATLYEPAVRSSASQTYVQPIVPYGVTASHGQAWARSPDGAAVWFRYGLAASTAILIYYRAAHVLPGDDVTAVTVPDLDLPMITLYACDRLMQSEHVDAVKRGSGERPEHGYGPRWKAELAARLRHGEFTTMTPLQ
jgi:hypothetical protein